MRIPCSDPRCKRELDTGNKVFNEPSDLMYFAVNKGWFVRVQTEVGGVQSEEKKVFCSMHCLTQNLQLLQWLDERKN